MGRAELGMEGVQGEEGVNGIVVIEDFRRSSERIGRNA